ncbi:hypothetical protein QS306_06520 [Paraburkholderia bonniea]|uniref:hypothetical protein n=1 Tax=Paraburkholderia bonniea TaxID=2152891 RepID=UPI002574492A|nr:hypothetical protein [Paraburkholderia bonniea]WJF91489.1 hypothetical protein QS306_06520 [Paraburkholderia bonniea]WJF94807.1 hypothetical protein QS308_06530 [Paraburkholderia bonniea]
MKQRACHCHSKARDNQGIGNPPAAAIAHRHGYRPGYKENAAEVHIHVSLNWQNNPPETLIRMRVRRINGRLLTVNNLASRII